jgi:acetylornithine aminotransferase/acetylornithine/N-succinyldiaminopimelate aminotransferase
MLGMELNSAGSAKQVVSQLMEHGILINRTHETVLRFLPPYIIEKKHIDRVIRELDVALSSAGPTPLSGQAHKSTARSQR